MALLEISNGFAMQIALSIGGIMAMTATATLLNLISIKTRKKLPINGVLSTENQQPTMMAKSAVDKIRVGSQQRSTMGQLYF